MSAALETVNDMPGFVRDLHSRNAGILSDKEQSTLMALRVLVAGCGSVGGSAVEPLVRLGVGSLVLADPDFYETTNLNRQLCLAADVGKSKVEVLEQRALAINPLLDVRPFRDGVTPENVASALEGVAVVFDAVDSAPPSLWSKYLLHVHAAERRLPVLLGVDFGGKPTVYVWDYRRDPRPFYGKAREADFREGREIPALRSYLGVSAIPADFLPVIRERASDGGPWPQVAYCATAMGAVVSRTVLDVALGRPVRHKVSVDLHQLPRTARRRLVTAGRWPLEAARTLWSLNGGGASFRVAPRAAAPAALSPTLRPIVEAIRLAPSGHNAQPWRLRLTGETTLEIGWDRRRALPVVDPEARYACYALGCAIESAATVADAEYEPGADGDPLDPEWRAGQLHVGALRPDHYLRARGLLGSRSTNRAPFLRQPPGPAAIRAIEDAGARFRCDVTTFTDPTRIGELADLTEEAAEANLSSQPFLEELLSWIRLSPDEPDFDDDGFTAETLRLAPPLVPLIRRLKRSERARRLAAGIGLPRAMARDARRTFVASGAVALLSAGDKTAQGRIRSGRALLSMWLAATHAGLAVQPVNFALDASGTPSRLAALAGIDPRTDLVALLRIGYATAEPAVAPRLPLRRILDLDLQPDD